MNLRFLRNDRENKSKPVQGGENAKFRKLRNESVGEYLEREAYSQPFRDDYLIPITAAIWSTTPDKCLHFSHHSGPFHVESSLTQYIGSTTRLDDNPGGSQQYIDAVMADPRKTVST